MRHLVDKWSNNISFLLEICQSVDFLRLTRVSQLLTNITRISPNNLYFSITWSPCEMYFAPYNAPIWRNSHCDPLYLIFLLSTILTNTMGLRRQSYITGYVYLSLNSHDDRLQRIINHCGDAGYFLHRRHSRGNILETTCREWYNHETSRV